MRLPHWLAHRWGKWEPYEAEVTRVSETFERYTAIEKRQRRDCEVCGFREDRTIRPAFRGAW